MLCHWLKPIDVCKEAAARYDAGGVPYVSFDCQNEVQARALYAEMQERFPHVPCTFHWLPSETMPAPRQLSFFDLEDDT